MALPPEPAVCIEHCWAGKSLEDSCPECNKSEQAEEKRWQSLTADQKCDELRQIILTWTDLD